MIIETKTPVIIVFKLDEIATNGGNRREASAHAHSLFAYGLITVLVSRAQLPISLILKTQQ